MVKTTVYLPASLKAALARRAAGMGRSEADLIREAIHRFVNLVPHAQPRIPLGEYGLGDPNAAERTDELLGDFGRP